MTHVYRPMHADDLDQILTVTILAWEPVFASFRQVLGEELFLRIYPDWAAGQRQHVAEVCANPEHVVWVADRDGAIGGFVTYTLDAEKLTGEITLLAVHPDHQGQGVGTALSEQSLTLMREAGMTLATVNTGGDTSHAPARRAYEKAGFTGLPLVFYSQVL